MSKIKKKIISIYNAFISQPSEVKFLFMMIIVLIVMDWIVFGFASGGDSIWGPRYVPVTIEDFI